MKRIFAVLLAVIMVIGMIPMSVFAVETGENLTITFETDFSTSMVVGDTFTVTGKLTNNPTFGAIALSLDWNEDAVEFTGFKTNGRVFASDVFNASLGYTAPIVNNDEGIITAVDVMGYDLNGMLFVANFRIVGDGALDIGLKTDSAAEFEIKNLEGTEDIPATINLSAVKGLTVGGKVVGAPVPDELVTAGVAAMTTDKGAVLGYTYMGENFAVPGDSGEQNAPVWMVKIPQGATKVYAKFDVPLMCNQSTDGEKLPSITYAQFYESDADVEEERVFELEQDTNGSSCIRYHNQEDNVVAIPVVMNVLDWYGCDTGDVIALLKTQDASYSQYGCEYYEGDEEYPDEYYYYVAGLQADITNAPVIAFFAFTYAEESGEEEETYSITVEQPTGGTVTVCDANMNKITEAVAGAPVYLQNTPAEGYRLVHYLIDGATVTEAELGMSNGCYTMPEKDVVISAVFELIPPTTYDVTVNTAQYGTVSADKTKAAAGEQVTLTVNPAEGYELDTLTVKQGETEIKVINNAFTMPDGAVTVSATFKKVVAGYRFATSADVSAENGGTATVHVKITGHSDPNVKNYNAYDLTLTFDSDKLEYQGYDGAVKSDKGSVTVSGNTIHIVGCGADKGFGTEIAALTFKTKAEGEAAVTIDKAQVSDKDTAVDDNIPEATPKHEDPAPGEENKDTTPSVSVIVVPYSVSKPGFITGNDKILHGETYTFYYTDTTNYTYADLTVTVGGAPVTPTKENGNYTIAGVTGAIVITATQTPNSYKVNKPEKVEGPDKATYGTPYIFTVTPSAEDMAIDTVKVTLADGSEVPYTVNDNGEYVIAGTNITGEFTITVTEKEKMTTVTFSGIEATEIEGGLIQTAVIGKDFTFTLIKEDGYDYIVKVGETELTESEETAGQYTVPAELVVKGGVQVDITKEDNTKPVVDVAEYINLDGKTMFLVTAKWRDKVLAYGENTMYYSGKYTVTGEEKAGAYCWLVVSTDEMNTVELVKAAAEAAIVEAAEGATATNVKYNYDINGTIKVDVNDAQLAYDMYNASYMEFSDTLPMWKFLEADMETDAKLDTKDVAAIISYIVSGANA